MDDLNKRIVAVRKANKMTQEAFADSLGTSRSNLANIETNKTKPTKMFIDLLCRKYDISEYWLLTGMGEMHKQLEGLQLVSFNLGKIMGGDDAFKQAFLSLLVTMPEEHWDVIKSFAEKLYEEYRRDE